MEHVKRLVGLWLAATWLLATPLAYAKNGDQNGAAPASGSVIGYQPIPNSSLPQASGAQYASASPAGGVMAPTQMQQIQPLQQIQPGGQTSITTPARSGYDYGIWLVGQGPYTLGRDDVITIEVRNQSEFSGNFVVGPDGSIQYNYIGDVPLLGLTKYAVQQVLEKLLEKYIRVPQVTVTIVGYNSKAVYVIGEVNRPGKYLMRGDTIKLREAIVAAGLPTRTAALWRTHIVKPDIDNPIDRKINLKKILYKGRLHDDINLFPGEIVVVPSTVLHSIDNFLSDLLNPITRSATAAAIGAGI